MKSFEVVVIGAGPGGYVAAIRAAQLGAKVGVIEKRELGGTCLNRGCIPTKTLVASANVAATVGKAAKFGIKTSGKEIDFKVVMERKNSVVKQLRDGIGFLFKSNGIELVQGAGRFLSPKELEVSHNGTLTQVQASKVIVASGSRSTVIPSLPIDGRKTITSDEILELTEIPKTLLIIGGGVIGIEYACIFNAFGTKVTVVEMLPRILPYEDEEVSEQMKRFLLSDGIEIKTEFKAEPSMFSSYDKVLVAVGRSPCTEGLELEKIGIQKQKNGAIPVNERMETSVPGIYAIGDIVPGPLLAHKASAEGKVAAENACGKDSVMDYKVLPSCIYSIPEVASVGLTETQAKQSHSVTVGKFPFKANSRAITLDETKGFVKIVSDKTTGEILGVHVIGPEATELIAECAVAMKLESTIEVLSQIIHPHPTLSEAVLECAETVLGNAINLPKKSGK